MPDGVIYLTIDQVLLLHKEIPRPDGEASGGLRSEQSLSSAVFQPQQSAYGQDAYPTVAEKAAAYGFFLAENQPFLNGNKRTALLAMAVFLDLNGYELFEDEDAIAQMFEDLGKKIIDQGEFFGWVCNHVREVSPH